MGTLVDSTPGSNFCQTQKPADISLGNIWYSPLTKQSIMSDGDGYWFSTSKGYATGGFSDSFLSLIDKMTFMDEFVSSLASTLTSVRSNAFPFSSVDNGYIGGGFIDTNQAVSTIDRIIFSADSCSLLNSTLTVTRANGGTLQNPVYGYAVGGVYGSNLYRQNIDRFSFSTENTSSILSFSSYDRFTNKGVWGETKGYLSGGRLSSPAETLSSSIKRLDFSPHTFTTIVSTLSAVREQTNGINGKFYGYICGGNNQVPAVLSIVERLNFNNEAMTNLGSKLSVERSHSAAIQSVYYGYLLGGVGVLENMRTIDRFNIINETASLRQAVLSVSRRGIAAVND